MSGYQFTDGFYRGFLLKNMLFYDFINYSKLGSKVPDSIEHDLNILGQE